MRGFQASSPDEIALVKIAEDIGITLEKRDQNSIVIKSILISIAILYIIGYCKTSINAQNVSYVTLHSESSIENLSINTF